MPTPTFGPVAVLRALAGVALAAVCVGGALVPARAVASPGEIRTLLVRGRVTDAHGAALAGARVVGITRDPQRGGTTFSMSAMADNTGNYNLAVPLGSAAGLARGLLEVEVRAERSGRRLSIATGPPLLAIELSLVAGADGVANVRVRSDVQSAATGVVAAFASDGTTTATITADFSEAPSTTAATLRFSEETPVPGLAAPKSAPPARPPAATPQTKPETPKVAPSKPKPVPAPSKPVAAKPVAPSAPGKGAPGRKTLPQDEPLTASPRARTVQVPALPAPDSTATKPPLTGAPTVAPPVNPAPSRVHRIEAFANPPAPRSPADTVCVCRMRGTVEVEWDRPKEERFKVRLVLDRWPAWTRDVQLFMGPPREFLFGPVPCGDHRLEVRTRSRLRYTLADGDSSMIVHCDGEGVTQVRLVLTPVR